MARPLDATKRRSLLDEANDLFDEAKQNELRQHATNEALKVTFQDILQALRQGRHSEGMPSPKRKK